jgi:hypothetical protein
MTFSELSIHDFDNVQLPQQLSHFLGFIPTLRLQLNRILVKDRKHGSGDCYETCYIVFQKLTVLQYK